MANDPPCPSQQSTNQNFLFHATAESSLLISGFFAGFWIWNSKTFEQFRRKKYMKYSPKAWVFNLPIECQRISQLLSLALNFDLLKTQLRKRAQVNDSSKMSHCWTSSEACSSRSNDIIDNIVNLGLSWVKTRSLRLIFSSFLRIIFNLFLEKSFQESFNARISTS